MSVQFIRWGEVNPQKGKTLEELVQRAISNKIGRNSYMEGSEGEAAWLEGVKDGVSEIHTYHRPPENVVGLYAFIRCEGFIDRFIIPSSVVRKLNPNNGCWDTLNDEINSGRESHGIVFAWSDVSAVWSRMTPTGETIDGEGKWYRYSSEQEDDFINAICLRGDRFLEEWRTNDSNVWPWNIIRDYGLTEVFLELK